MSQARLSVSSDDSNARVRVSGRATFECSEDLKLFCQNRLDNSCKRIVIYMKECTGMDSTFMGILTMLSLTAKQKGAIIELSDTNNDNRKNLFSLGLKTMFEFTDSPTSDTPEWQEVEQSTLTQDQHAENVLNAHQTLIDVYEDNRKEFQDIVDFLKQQNG